MIHLALFDLDAELEPAFTRWYERDHVPRMLAQSGWKRMARYRCTDGHPLISLYELDEGVPLHPFISEAPFRSGAFAARGVRNYHARTWRRIQVAGTPAWSAAWVNVITVDIDTAHADLFDRWYRDVHVPEILACPGWRAAQRFECVDGDPRFLAIYDLDDPETPFTSDEWDSAVGWDEHVDHIRGFHGFRVYERIFDCEPR